ncbi:MAG: bifunctional riboflavin kinase/FMN adenylyltransferase, partial [Propionibacteriaceae bacterium]|nr:bifunctional riboflavin kinase/FMN adenylyltransferase [Propionibacteriaceae bacterium]
SESPADFVRTVIGPLEPKVVVVGENFRFGSKAAGDVSTLDKLGKGRFEENGLPLVRFADEETCSTRIREALEAGNVRHAAEHLGRLFAFRGKVVHGDHRGHSLGFPTANVAIPDDREAPADGVYAGWLTRLDGLDGCGGLLVGGEKPTRFPAAISVGNNPTFEAGAKRRIEAHIPGRDDLDLYGAPVSVEFVERLRGMVKFNSKDELIAQMKADVDETLELLA